MGADDASSAEMPRRHANPDRGALDEETVERLLAGDLPADQAPPGYGEVAAVLAAMAAPPGADELAGRETALAELRRLDRATSAAAGRPASRSGRRRRVGLAAVVVLGALAAGGGAAAATGQLPAPVRDAARTILATVNGREPGTPPGPGGSPASAKVSPDAGRAGTGAKDARSTGTTARDPAGVGAGSAAGPAAGRLCRAYGAGKGGERGKKLDAAAFQALARAAGGADRISAYCQELSPGSAAKGNGRQPGDEQKAKQGGPPATTGQGNAGKGGLPPNSNGGNQGPPDTRPHRG